MVCNDFQCHVASFLNGSISNSNSNNLQPEHRRFIA